MKAIRKYAILWMPPAMLLAAYLCRNWLWKVAQWVSDYIIHCVFYDSTGIFCPGCGGTRSMLALIHGDFLRALHDNPASPAIVLFALLWYAELIAAKFGKKLRLIPRSAYFWMTLCGLLIVWDIFRNFIPAMQPTPLS